MIQIIINQILYFDLWIDLIDEIQIDYTSSLLVLSPEGVEVL